VHSWQTKLADEDHHGAVEHKGDKAGHGQEQDEDHLAELGVVQLVQGSGYGLGLREGLGEGEGIGEGEGREG
jgi:hypothetical protein